MEIHDHSTMTPGEHSPKEVLKFALVIGFILLIAGYLNETIGPSNLDGFLRWLMGTFFGVFGSFKLIGYKMFVEMFAGYDVLAKRSKTYAKAYPFLELALAGFYLTDSLPGIRDVITLVVMVIGTIGVAEELKRRSGIHCACLGNIIKLPLSTVSLVEDVSMGLMALYMLLK